VRARQMKHAQITEQTSASNHPEVHYNGPVHVRPSKMSLPVGKSWSLSTVIQGSLGRQWLNRFGTADPIHRFVDHTVTTCNIWGNRQHLCTAVW